MGGLRAHCHGPIEHPSVHATPPWGQHHPMYPPTLSLVCCCPTVGAAPPINDNGVGGPGMVASTRTRSTSRWDARAGLSYQVGIDPTDELGKEGGIPGGKQGGISQRIPRSTRGSPRDARRGEGFSPHRDRGRYRSHSPDAQSRAAVSSASRGPGAGAGAMAGLVRRSRPSASRTDNGAGAGPAPAPPRPAGS